MATVAVLSFGLAGCSLVIQPQDGATTVVPNTTSVAPPTPATPRTGTPTPAWPSAQLATGQVFRLGNPTAVGTMTVTRISETDLVFQVEGLPELTTRSQLRVYAGEHDPFDDCLPERFDRVFPMGTFGDVASAADATKVTWEGAGYAPEVISGEYVDAQITDFVPNNALAEGNCAQPTIAYARLNWH